MNKPKFSVKITSIADPTITRTFNKATGLKMVSVDGGNNSIPYYGIVSRAGQVELIDMPYKDEQGQVLDGWIKVQSDRNIFPDVSVDIYIGDCLVHSFLSNNDISYSKQDKLAKIELSDSILLLQEESSSSDLVYTNTNAFLVFLEMMTSLGLTANIDKETKQYLISINIPKIVFKRDTKWNIINQFAYGTRSIFYKLGNSYFLRRMRE